MNVFRLVSKASPVNPNRPGWLIRPAVVIALLFALIASVSFAADDQKPTAKPAPTDPPALPTLVPMTDPQIRLIGRFDTSKPASARCAWSASAVALRFEGTALNVDLRDGPNDRFEIVVDGQPSGKLATAQGRKRYTVVSDLSDADHTVELYKITEPIFGTADFRGFEIQAGKHLLPLPPRSDRRIEVIGDSISCGYGNEAKDQKEHFSCDTENNYQTYGAIAARELGAEYTCIAWSGKCMWPKNTMPELYDLILPWEPGLKWDFSKPAPQAVLIMLGTNDFAGKTNPPEDGWTGGYEAFIKHLRSVYPDATIYLASSPMMNDSYPAGNKARTTIHEYLLKIADDLDKAGDKKVHYLEIPTQDGKNGIGADWHPSVKTHTEDSKLLIDALQHDLGWTADGK